MVTPAPRGYCNKKRDVRGAEATSEPTSPARADLTLGAGQACVLTVFVIENESDSASRL